MMVNQNNIAPTFLYVGAPKAGSTWIYEILREHPEIFVPTAKEAFFFDRYYDRGWSWYLSLFEKASDYRVRGELSHDYYLSDECARRIKHDLPDVKIMACLREGVDRTLSAYMYDRTIFFYVRAEEYKKGLTFEEFASLPVMTQIGDYYHNLKLFYELFPREDILVLFYEDLKRNPAAFAREIFEFLGVERSFEPSCLNRKVNVSRKARNVRLAELAFHGGQLLRKIGAQNLMGSVKRQSWFESLLYKPVRSDSEKPVVTLETKRRLWDLYHRFDDELAELIGRPVPDSWAKPSG